MAGDYKRQETSAALLRGDAELNAKKSPASGLGKDLSGILDSAYTAERSPEVAGLFGRVGAADASAVRRLVSEIALGALMGGFDAEGALLAWQSEGVPEPELAADVGPIWQRIDGPGFTLAAKIGAMLERTPNGSELDKDWPAPMEFEVNDRSVRIGRQDAGSVRLASALIRSTPLGATDQVPLRSLLRSVAAAMAGERYAVPPGGDLTVTIRQAGAIDDRSASAAGGGPVAVLGYGSGEGRALVEAPGDDVPMAVAAAAAALLSEPYDVEFAGQSDIGGNRQVTVVVLSGADGAPIVGLSIDPPRSRLGPAAAVLNAAQSVGVLPELDSGRIETQA